MKKQLFTIALLAMCATSWAQENMFSVNGGYTFITGDEVLTDLSGWRINGVYEFAKEGGPLSMGVAFGYTSVSGITETGNKNIEIGTIPIYFQPKFFIGDGPVKGYVKGALGWQFSNFTVGGIETDDSGLFAGGGAGVLFDVSDSFFINAEYEIAWMNNYYYRDGWLNSAMGGIGIRF